MKTLAEPRDAAELLRRLHTLDADRLRRWGRMTAPQMVCHLAEAFLMAVGDKPVRPRVSLLTRTLVKWTALYLPLPWPPGIPTSPELDATCRATGPARFADDVARLQTLLERVAAPDATFTREPHPLFGRLSGAEWQRWGYLHVDHHLRQFGA